MNKASHLKTLSTTALMPWPEKQTARCLGRQPCFSKQGNHYSKICTHPKLVNAMVGVDVLAGDAYVLSSRQAITLLKAD